MVVDGDGEAEITENGGTLQLKAIVEPESASNKEVTWSVDDESIATISNTGLLTAIDNGTITVEATTVSTPSVSGTVEIEISGQEEELDTSKADFITAFRTAVTTAVGESVATVTMFEEDEDITVQFKTDDVSTPGCF